MVERQGPGVPGDCPICWSPYDNAFRTPKLLQCGHSFCIECLAHLSLVSATRGQLHCPLCRRLTLLRPGRPVTELPTDEAALGRLGLRPNRIVLEGHRLSLQEPRKGWYFLRQPRVYTLDLGPEADPGPETQLESPPSTVATRLHGCRILRDGACKPQLRVFLGLMAVLLSLTLVLFFFSFWTKQFLGGWG